MRGLELCRAAGYNLRPCLRLFDILSDDAEDRGDLAGAYGPDAEIDPLVADTFQAKAHNWDIHCTVWFRYGLAPDAHDGCIGFRLVLAPG